MAREIDEHAARDLELYVDNTFELYRLKLRVFRRMSQFMDRGAYSVTHGRDAFLPMLRFSAKAYMAEILPKSRRPYHFYFNAATRNLAAIHLEQEFQDWHRIDRHLYGRNGFEKA